MGGGGEGEIQQDEKVFLFFFKCIYILKLIFRKMLWKGINKKNHLFYIFLKAKT